MLRVCVCRGRREEGSSTTPKSVNCDLFTLRFHLPISLWAPNGLRYHSQVEKTSSAWVYRVLFYSQTLRLPFLADFCDLLEFCSCRLIASDITVKRTLLDLALASRSSFSDSRGSALWACLQSRRTEEHVAVYTERRPALSAKLVSHFLTLFWFYFCLCFFLSYLLFFRVSSVMFFSACRVLQRTFRLCHETTPIMLGCRWESSRRARRGNC